MFSLGVVSLSLYYVSYFGPVVCSIFHYGVYALLFPLDALMHFSCVGGCEIYDEKPPCGVAPGGFFHAYIPRYIYREGFVYI